MTARDCAFWVWLVLVALTGATWLLGRGGFSGQWLVPVLLLSVAIKGQLVADRFMGLARVRSGWRWVVSGWLLAVIVLIGIAFRIGGPTT